MSNALKVAAGLGAEEKLYVDDVFSTYLYTGNGSTKTITNGIDLAGKGGLVWIKQRTSPTDNRNDYHCLVDTARGSAKVLSTSGNSAGTVTGTSAQFDESGSVSAFNSNGFNVFGYTPNGGATNENGKSFVSWTFRRAQRFFDVVTYTGNGVAGRQIPHNLGVAPGMVIVKSLSTGHWHVYHRSRTAMEIGYLNLTNAFVASGSAWNDTEPTASVFTLGSGNTNISSEAYVAYIFAHDTSADGIIQCGSFTTDGGGNATVNLGWEQQYLTCKRSDSTSDWMTLDTMRGWAVTNPDNEIYPNASYAEGGANRGSPTATGFTHTLAAFATYVYLAIRRPNKPPTSGTQVYNAIARTGTGAAASVTGVGFAPDLYLCADRTRTNNSSNSWMDRLRGTRTRLNSNATSIESTGANYNPDSFNNDGVTVTANDCNANGVTFINHFFRRAPGVFDVVCDTGTSADRNISHNLGVAPELIIRKSRSNAYNWQVYCQYATGNLALQTTAAQTATQGLWKNPGVLNMTASVFSVTCSAEINSSSDNFISYLFATKAGISKVGSYTGNGSSQTINCGFTAGARFVLIKRTDSTGDWFVWDSTRGIVAGNDPHLSLNTTAAEITTDDSIDPDNSGFIVNQLAATNINVTSATYIYLALA